MTLMNIRNLGVTLSAPLFSRLNLVVNASDRIGLVAANGRGKTTLLRCMAGTMEASEGEITRSRGLTVGHVEQDMPEALMDRPFYAAGAPRPLADQLWALHSNAYDYGATRPNATARQVQRYETVFKSTIYETEHPVVQVHPQTGERAIILGYFVRKLLGVSSADSAHLFAMLQDHVTRLENTVRWRWSAGDVVIWDNRATQHKAIDDYGDQPRIVRRVTIDGPVSVGIDGRHGERRNSDAQVTAAA